MKTKKITRGKEVKSSIVNFGTKGTGRQASFKRLVYCSQTVQTNSGNLHYQLYRKVRAKILGREKTNPNANPKKKNTFCRGCA